MTKKTCSKCKLEKDFADFSKDKSKKDGLRSYCNACKKQYQKDYRQKRVIPEKEKEYQKKYQKNYRYKNKKSSKEYQKTYNKKYREENKEKLKEYKKNNRDKINRKAKERRESDPMFKLKTYLRNRVYSILKGNKSKSTRDLLGADYKTVKLHLESTFKEGMSWENYGEWHVDHIVPLASAKTQEEVESLFRYTNLQALWAFDNISKGAKVLKVT